MKKLFISFVLISLTICTYAQPPQKMNYQAVVRNSSGALVTNHAVGMRVSILKGSATGTTVYRETYNPVPQTNANGLVTVEIGSGTPSIGPFSAIDWASGTYFLKTETDPSGGTNYTITGTSQLLSIPFALYSNKTGSLKLPYYGEVTGTLDSAFAVRNWSATGKSTAILGESINYGVKGKATGKVGRGVYGEAVSTGAIGVYGKALALNSTGILGEGFNQGVYGVSTEETGKGVYGMASSTTGENYGLYGVSNSTSGTGIYGSASASSGTVYGVRGHTNSSGGYAGYFEGRVSVRGSTTGNTDLVYLNNQSTGRALQAVAGSNTAVWGRSTTGYAGVHGESGSGYGIAGRSTSNHGVDGRSTSNHAIYGLASATTGSVYGGYFESKSPDGKGIYCLASATTVGESGVPIGGYFESKGEEMGIGVVAKGIRGIEGRGSTGGWFSGTDYAGWFSGAVNITGNLTKGGGSFQIDHPLDPENKILRHSFVESPDMMNIYNGNVITDGNGTAVVILPGYFEALNMDFRYQLTVIGDFAQAIIATKIINNSFTIRTDKPNVEVSWQVTGIRKDPWAEKNRIVVEENKEPELQGSFIHPLPYGLPESRSVEWVDNPVIFKKMQEQSEHRIYEH